MHDLEGHDGEKDVDYDGDRMIYEVCNPHQAKKVLEANGAISVALPCRIWSTVAAANSASPRCCLRNCSGFPQSELDPVAKEVEQVMVAMMRDAA